MRVLSSGSVINWLHADSKKIMYLSARLQQITLYEHHADSCHVTLSCMDCALLIAGLYAYWFYYCVSIITTVALFKKCRNNIQWTGLQAASK